jgi:hypothetical protein
MHHQVRVRSEVARARHPLFHVTTREHTLCALGDAVALLHLEVARFGPGVSTCMFRALTKVASSFIQIGVDPEPIIACHTLRLGSGIRGVDVARHVVFFGDGWIGVC